MVKRITIDELAVMVADDFAKAIESAECDDFRGMKDLYDWDSTDIRREVEYTINSSETGWEMMDDSDLFHFGADGCSDEDVPYRTFINKVYKEMKRRSIY